MWMWTKAQVDYQYYIDHRTKFVNVRSIHNKLADEVLNEVQKYCVTYNHPNKFNR